MSSVLGKCLSNAPNIQLLDEEQAARSIVVSNISPQTTKEDVTIHFQRQKNGGGEIHSVHIPEKGTAVITFEEMEVAATVLRYSHTIKESTLKLHRLIPDDSPEVLALVKARLNFDRFQLSAQEWGKALEVLKHKTGVRCSYVSNNDCVLSGTFNQILTAQTLLGDIRHGRSVVLQQSIGGNDAFHQSDTTQIQQNSSATWDNDVTDNFDTKDLNSFEVQPQFMKLIKRVYEKKLRCIEETYGLKIVWTEDASQVQMRPSKASSNPRRYQEGCDSFIDLYQGVFPNMCREEVEVESGAPVIEAINSVETENNVVIEMEENKLVVYAEKNEILRSLQALRKKLGLQQGGSRRARRSHQRNTTPGGLENRKTLQDNQFSASPSQFLKQSLRNGVYFSLYQGDITDERVDAIVNAANECLRHGGGVAAAIVRKGGRQIEKESRQIMLDRNERPLNIGDAVYTKGGNLSCRYVIHTVGPRWNHHDRQRSSLFLQRACMESLCLAAELKLSSIAFPAVSSGIFGMPKSLCAQVMFKAIEEFSSSTDARFSTLRDVRIVVIDDETISVFQEEFVNRYSSQRTSSTALPNPEHRPRPLSEEQEVSSSSNIPVKDPSVSSFENSSEEQPKKSGEDNAIVESSNEEADPNLESKKPNETFPDSLKKLQPYHNSNTPNASKDNPHNGNENTNVEADLHGSNEEKSLRGSPLEQMSNESGKDSVHIESSNERVGPLGDANEHREEIPDVTKEGLPSNNNNYPSASKDNPPSGNAKSNAETEVHGSNMGKDIEGSPLMKNSKSSNMATAARSSCGRGRGILAPTFYSRLQQEASKSESNKSTELAKAKETRSNYVGKGRGITFAFNTSPPGPTVTEEGKRVAQNLGNRVKRDQTADPAESIRGEEELERNESSDGAFKEQNQELYENFQNSDDDKCDGVPRSRLPNKDGITKPDETKFDTNGGRELPTDKKTNNRAGPSQPIHSSTNKTSDNLTPTHGSANVRDMVQEREAAHSDVGSKPLSEIQTGEVKCSMCMNLTNDPVSQVECGHSFCKSCAKHFVEKAMMCPVCKKENLPRANQPVGYMTWRSESFSSLPGYEKFGTIVLTFNFDSGIQGSEHPNPGEIFVGLFCTAYLPDNPAGREVCSLLRSAFNARLIFTIGKCPATGEDNKTISNGIELKTNRSGGPANCGYPDPSYLDRVKSQLTERGITQFLEYV